MRVAQCKGGDNPLCEGGAQSQTLHFETDANKREVGGERVSTLSHWDKIEGAGHGEEKAGVFQRCLHV